MKRCSKCKMRWPRTAFHQDKKRADGLCCWCKACTKKYRSKEKRAAAQARWTAAHPEQSAAINAHSRYVRTGMSPQAYRDLLVLQDGRCAVCERPLRPGRATSADHDHTTKKFRGLLCGPCNTTEGMIRKMGLTPTGFGARLQQYLDNPPADLLVLV